MVKIGVIGCRYWGPKIVRSFQSLKDCEVSMVADLDPKVLINIKKDYPHLSVTQNYKDILKNSQIDAVSIATPASTHYSLAKEALLAGKHVLTEKPMAITVKEGEELIMIAKKSGKVLMVGHTFEYSPSVRKIKEIIKKGELGELFFISSSRVNLGLHRSDVNVVWDLATHDVSILTYLLEKNPLNVSARGKCFVRKNLEDFAFIEFEFPGKIVSHVYVSWLAPVKERRLIIVGSKKMLVYEDTNLDNPITIYNKGIVRPISQKSKQKAVSYYDKGVSYPKASLEEPLKIECRHFIDCIKNKRTPLTDGRRGTEVLKILEAIQKSLNSNGHLIEIN